MGNEWHSFFSIQIMLCQNKNQYCCIQTRSFIAFTMRSKICSLGTVFLWPLMKSNQNNEIIVSTFILSLILVNRYCCHIDFYFSFFLSISIIPGKRIVIEEEKYKFKPHMKILVLVLESIEYKNSLITSNEYNKLMILCLD